MNVLADDVRRPVDPAVFRDAMALLAAPLTIVTTLDAQGHRQGFTASSVTSASLEPPLLLVGLSNTSSCRPALTQSDGFVVNVLGEQHAEVAGRFAARDVDRFAEQDFGSWPGCGLPYLTDANAVLRCTTVDRVPVGDHLLLIGELTGVLTPGSAPPLLWYQRAFRSTRRAS
ncbi:flavin reductase family protein [Streptomyces sp. DT2A-34]|uniref:flavin reductase family protein n=1 Tax=Streptomyces sp. DT2A-34 TaxID=3051182 RepID=UPI00265C5D59|nr:flavin reductase family protein [Streptomyces sp. DT2A-34]MDO0914709.1 flavin reductase family protein [Streptomyces sp. DT2A-34]